MKNVILKTGSYFILILGIIISILVLILGLYTLMTAHGAIEKRGIVIAGCLIIILIILYGTIILFETIRGIVKIEDEIEELEEEKILK